MTEFERSLGLDVGHVRIGVAVSDPMGIIAQPKEVIQCTSPEGDIEAVRRIIEETEASTVVVGIPLNMEGKHGPQAEKTLEFVERLRAATYAEIVLQDERYSTAAAERMLIGHKVRRKGRKKVIDKVAATHILQTWLDRRAREKERGGGGT